MAGQLLKTCRFVACRILPNNRNGFSNMQPLVRTLKSETKDLLNRLKIPEKPKRPLTPFVQFLKERQPAIVKENPTMKQSEIMKKIAKDWREVSDEQKEKYAQKFETESKSYNVAILNYNASLTSEQQEGLKSAATERKEDRKKRKLKKICKETNKPKKPSGPYILFLQEESKARNIPFNHMMSTVKGEWEKLPAAEKSRYREQYLAEKKKYEIALIEWEQEMVGKGHPELVRTTSVVDNPSRILSVRKDKKEPYK
ncbi:unnamed protein product [Phaedon cochleariae]|uniref:HMG box domain-containing protein n=1 Tax=Phaedon cochleariae TaxID=80249 RepID=A0A9P0DFN4_PHACE|nr:unnamed protein product [Phaedon cochleariae]